MQDDEMPPDSTDADAVAELQRGEISGLEPLVCRYQSPALRLAIALTGDRDLAEDAVSDAFIAVNRYIGSFDPSRPFEPWFYRILVNRIRRLARHEQQERRVQQAWFTTFHRADLLTEESAVEAELQALVRDAIRQLPIKQREVLVLVYYLDLDLATVAKIQSVPLGTVKWRLYQGRRQLGAILAPHVKVPVVLDTEGMCHEPQA